MLLTKETALRAYAKMLNTLNVDCLEPLLADDFTYESQYVFQALESKLVFLEYIRQKLKTIEKAKAPVFAEMGTVLAYGENQSCVILAQDDRENLVAIVLVETEGSKIKRLDLCMIPPPHAANRSGEYPV